MNSNLVSRLFGGLFLVGIGVLFLLNQMDVIDLDIGYTIRTFWPVILIFLGLRNILAYSKHTHGRSISIGNLILTAVGCYFLARNLNYIDLSIGEFIKFMIPAALILIGLYVLLKPRRQDDSYKQDPYTFDPGINDQATFSESPKSSQFDWDWQPKAMNKSGFIGDVHMGQDYWELKPMNISHFIGDTVLDLTKAQIPYGETKVNVSSFIGDVKVYIPNDMEVGVVVTSSAFLGDVKVLDQYKGGFMTNIKNETPFYMESSKKVRIVVSAFIGDVKVSRVG